MFDCVVEMTTRCNYCHRHVVSYSKVEVLLQEKHGTEIKIMLRSSSSYSHHVAEHMQGVTIELLEWQTTWECACENTYIEVVIVHKTKINSNPN